MQGLVQLIPLIGIFNLMWCKRREEIQWVGMGYAIIGMIHMLGIVHVYTGETSVFEFQYYGKLGQDGISQWLVWQVSILMPIVLLSTWKSTPGSENVDMYRTQIILLQQIGFWSYAVFMVQDLQLFYISFEGVLIPMYFQIGQSGNRNRKIHAANQFFIYTLLGSQFQLLALIVLYLETGTSDYQTILTIPISPTRQYILWLAFFFALAIKIPMVPMHIWLPEAHTECHTAGSVLQAAILLKQGSFGIQRYCLPLFPIASSTFTPQVATICIIGIIYSSIACLAQWDIKKQIAYSSIGHMNTATLAIFTNDQNGINASIYFLISHGQISSALFLLIGVIYDRYHTRTIKYYRGLVLVMPMFTVFFLFFTLANIAVPGTSGFISEFFTFLAAFQQNPFIGVVSALAIILAPVYSLWFFHKISYGSLSPHLTSIFSDITIKEFHLLLPLVILTLLFGFFPSLLLSPITLSSLALLY